VQTLIASTSSFTVNHVLNSMTSFSTYASKFLSSGAATGSTQPHQSSIYRPFSSSQYPLGEEEERDGEEDAFGSAELPHASRNRHHLPHLADDRGEVKGQSSSRSKRANQESMNDIDDEDDGDDDEDGRNNVYRDQRGRVSLPTGSSLLDDSKHSTRGDRRDEHDPFLAEDDLHARSTLSSSESPQRHVRGPSSEAKAKGWMAHVADSSSAASTASYTGKKTRRTELPNDIYRDPDEDEEEELSSSSRRKDKGKRAATRVGGKDRYSIYDEADSSASISVTTSEDSDDEDDSRRRRWRAFRRTDQKAQVSKAAGSIGSSLREPLLSSASAETLGKPPGAYRGNTSRIASADIYTYPHPPAKAGWTPWAPGNRVSLGEYKDKVALLLWFGLVAGTLIVAVWMVAGTKVRPMVSYLISLFVGLTRISPLVVGYSSFVSFYATITLLHTHSIHSNSISSHFSLHHRSSSQSFLSPQYHKVRCRSHTSVYFDRSSTRPLHWLDVGICR
jgi:hypothetical protein